MNSKHFFTDDVHLIAIGLSRADIDLLGLGDPMSIPAVRGVKVALVLAETNREADRLTDELIRRAESTRPSRED